MPEQPPHPLPDNQAEETGPASGGLIAIFVEQRAVLLRFLGRRLQDAALAEDVLQDVWIKLDDRPPTRPIADPLAYLFQVCENAARDLRRSEARRHLREKNWAEHSAPGGPESETEPSPEQRAIEREALQRIGEKLERLPDRTRHIFVAFRLEGRPQKDLAHDHGISLSAVQKHLQRAYRALFRPEEEENSADTDAGRSPP